MAFAQRLSVLDGQGRPVIGPPDPPPGIQRPITVDGREVGSVHLLQLRQASGASTSAAGFLRAQVRDILLLAGVLLGPILTVQSGMGEGILILAFVVIVIGGIGSIRGALAGALLVGMVDTLSRTLLPVMTAALAPEGLLADLGAAVSSMLIYILMAAVLFFKPEGLFPARG
eukprot:gene29909-33757_t